MSTLSPTSPLLTLIVTPAGETTTKSLLAQFHPIMKTIGFGHFQMEEPNFHSASRGGENFWQPEEFILAEILDEKLFINLDGKSILFGAKGIRKILTSIQEEYQNRIDCNPEVIGPDIKGVLMSNFVFTLTPILLGACVGLFLANLYYDTFRMTIHDCLYGFTWVFLIAVGSRTRYWVKQRRKKRPAWQGVLVLFSAPVIIFLAFPFSDWVFGLF